MSLRSKPRARRWKAGLLSIPALLAAAATPAATLQFTGNTATSGTAGNIRSFSDGAVSVKASAFGRTTSGSWGAAYLGAWAQGLGTTDFNEGTGANGTHRVDNIGNYNFVLFEFSEPVVVTQAYLDSVVGDSDIKVWIGTFNNPFQNHLTLSDALLGSCSVSEVNDTTSGYARWANFNGGQRTGNVVVIAASTADTTPDDQFKISKLTYNKAGGLGNFVWNDLNKNGIQDAGEPGLQGVTVKLYTPGPDNTPGNSDDVLKGTQTTSTGGAYWFGGLDAGKYYVQFTTPSGFVASPANQGTSDSKDSDSVNGRTGVYTLAACASNDTVDAGFYAQPVATAKLGDLVWLDSDNNGIQDADETGLPGVTVGLYRCSDNGLVSTQVTDSYGKYLFTGLAAGSYYVKVTAPTGYVISPANQTGDTADSDGDASGKSPCVNLAAGATDTSVDFGLFELPPTGDCTPTGFSFAGTSATSGAFGNIFTYTSGGVSVNASAFSRNSSGAWAKAYLGAYQGGLGVTDVDEGTGANGTHRLDNIANRNYILLEFSAPVVITQAMLDSVVSDSDISVWIGTFSNPFANHLVLNDSVLASFGYREDNDTTLSTARWATFNGGEIVGNAVVIAASVSDTTPEDQFKLSKINVCIPPTQVPPAALGNFVWLDKNADGDQDGDEPGVPGVTVELYTCDNVLKGTDVTDGAGIYGFDNLTPGSYYVKFVAPSGSVLTTANVGNDSLDSDAAADGKTACVTLAPGETNNTLDAGVYQPASLGDYVWLDKNADGDQDGDEPGVPGVTVELYTCDNVFKGTATTDATGRYGFGNLTPGSYYVKFLAPSGYVLTAANVGNDSLDSDAAADGKTACVTLASGENNPTLDAGLYQLASLGDYVWQDKNADGDQDGDELPVPGVTVELYTCDNVFKGTATTSANGLYSFGGLIPGSYYVKFLVPSGYVLTTANVGNDSLDSDAAADGKTACVTLASGENNPTLDAGLYQVASLGDYVWLDKNADGDQDGDEPGVPGVTVELYTCDNVFKGTATTDATGRYSFENLTPGSYYVKFLTPSGYVLTTVNVGDDALDSDAAADGKTACVTLASGESNKTLDAGLYQLASLGDYVWLDKNADGDQDGDEPGVPNVTVELYTCDNVYKGTATTGANGLYGFDNLTPGSYYVKFIVPSGYVLTTANVGDDALDSDAAADGTTICVTLASGDSNKTLDAGVYQLASLGDYVWLDKNENGIQDGDETGVSGVTVELYTCDNVSKGTDVTDGAGLYGFENLTPGSYYVKFIVPSGYVLTLANATTDTLDSDAAADGKTACVTLASGENNPTLDAGIHCTGPEINITVTPDSKCELPPMADQLTGNYRMIVRESRSGQVYLREIFSGLPEGILVQNAISNTAWCLKQSAQINTGVPYAVTFYRSDRPIPAEAPAHIPRTNYDYVNYIINHKQGSYVDIQVAIWTFIGGPLPATGVFSTVGPNAQAMIDAALANGAGFQPGPTDKFGVIVDAGPLIQLTLIEVSCVEPSPCAGGPVTLCAEVSGTDSYTYQWKRNGEEITGATDRCLRVEAPDWANEQYCVVVSGPCSTITQCVTLPCGSTGTVGTQSVDQADTAVLEIRAADGSVALEAELTAGSSYRVEGTEDGNEWFEVGTVRPDDQGQFIYEVTSDRKSTVLRLVEEPQAPKRSNLQ